MKTMKCFEESLFDALDPFARAHVSPSFSGGKPETGPLDQDAKTHAQCILAIDTGTQTGWALRQRDGTIKHGTQVFALRKSQPPGQRWIDYRAWLARMIQENQAHVLAYETVMFGVGGQASGRAGDVYGAWKCMIEMAACLHNLELITVAPSTVKKAVTGSGRAKKPEVIAEIRRRGFRPDTDNAADALAILAWAVAQEKGT